VTDTGIPVTLSSVADADLARGSYIWGHGTQRDLLPPEDAEAALRFWRNRATKLEAEVAELKPALARKKAFEAGGHLEEPIAARR
jgi:hypothetical protein